MSTVKEIYKTLLIGEGKVKLRIGDRKEYDTVRTGLCKEHRTPAAIGLTDGSLCSNWSEETGIAEFWIGESRKKKARTWEVIDDGE